MRHNNIFLILGSCFFLSACGTGTENSTKEEELADRLELSSSLEPLVGIYNGILNQRPDGSDPFPIELSLFIVEEENGVNHEGEPQFRPSLRARYRRTDLLTDGIGERTLKVRFYKEENKIAGTTTSTPTPGSGNPDARFLSFTGSVTENGFDLEFRDHRGILGYAKIDRNP